MFYVGYELEVYLYPDEPSGPYYVPDGYESEEDAQEAADEFSRRNPGTYTYVFQR